MDGLEGELEVKFWSLAGIFLLWNGTGSEMGVGDFEFGGMVLIRGRILKICEMVYFLCLCW